MKKEPSKGRAAQSDADEILPEYDFSRARRNKYAGRYAVGSAVVVLEPMSQLRFQALERPTKRCALWRA